MKRSVINEILKESDAFIRSFGFALPPFAYLSPEEMKATDHSIWVERSMGWDITDYGQGKFDELGLFLFTLRNGNPADLAKGKGMLYAEKLLISRIDQISPMHRHYTKAEDIINRGGGKMVMELYGPDEEGKMDRHNDVTVPVDGRMVTLPAGSLLKLDPGESITLMPGIWHAFWAEGKDVLIGEVSTVNDDRTDNWFEQELGRFPSVEEDEAPVHLMVSDYDKYLK